MTPFCAKLTQNVSFKYDSKVRTLAENDVVKVLDQGDFGILAIAKTPDDGCKKGLILNTDCFSALPNCDDFQCSGFVDD